MVWGGLMAVLGGLMVVLGGLEVVWWRFGVVWGVLGWFGVFQWTAVALVIFALELSRYEATPQENLSSGFPTKRVSNQSLENCSFARSESRYDSLKSIYQSCG